MEYISSYKSLGFKSGFLMKQSQGGRKTWKKRFFVLTHDQLMYWKDKEQSGPASETISLEKYVSIKPRVNASTTPTQNLSVKKLMGFILETDNRTLIMHSESRGEMEDWILRISTVGDLIKVTKSKAFSSNSQYESKLIMALNHLLLNSSKLLICCLKIISTSKNDNFKENFHQILTSQFGGGILDLIAAGTKAAKSPFDSLATDAVSKALSSVSVIVSNLIHTIVEYNKNSGGENAQYKEELITCLKSIKENLEQVQTLSKPDARTEILNSASLLLTSVEKLMQSVSKSATSKLIDTTQMEKIVKDDFRFFFGLVNLCKPAAVSAASYEVFQADALKLNYKIKELLSSVSTFRTESTPAVTETLHSANQAVVSLTTGLLDRGKTLFSAPLVRQSMELEALDKSFFVLSPSLTKSSSTGSASSVSSATSLSDSSKNTTASVDTTKVPEVTKSLEEVTITPSEQPQPFRSLQLSSSSEKSNNPASAAIVYTKEPSAPIDLSPPPAPVLSLPEEVVTVPEKTAVPEEVPTTSNTSAAEVTPTPTSTSTTTTTQPSVAPVQSAPAASASGWVRVGLSHEQKSQSRS